MKVRKNWNKLPSSTSFEHPHNPMTLSLPIYVDFCGHEYRNSDYFQELEDMNSKFLCYTIAGEGIITYKNLTLHSTPGTLFLLDCKDKNFYKTFDDSWEVLWFHFNGFASDFYYNIINGDSFKIISCDSNANILYTLYSIYDLAPSYGINHDMNILMLFSNLFNYLFDMQYEAPLDNIPFHLKKPIKAAVKYFNENFSEKIIVEELLKEWHVTPCNFYKYFKIYTGKTPYDYLISIRLSRSKFFLKYSDLSVNEIALKVGFNNTNNYIREFVKYYKVTPKQYKISVYDS